MAQPLFYPACLSTSARAHHVYSPQFILEGVLREHNPVITVIPHQQSSDQFALINYAAYNLPRRAVQTAFTAYRHAKALGYDKQDILTIVDYAIPSDHKRLLVIDAKHGKLLLDTYVSHGTHSGDRYARKFSNQVNSHESSLGVLLTGKAYDGLLGYSLRLHGLEQQFNSNDYIRDIVVHPATYVGAMIAKKFHEVGKSFGCLAVNSKVAPHLINLIKSGTIIVNYYPSKRWLAHSRFLH
jgi:hypothetical protein